MEDPQIHLEPNAQIRPQIESQKGVERFLQGVRKLISGLFPGISPEKPSEKPLELTDLLKELYIRYYGNDLDDLFSRMDYDPGNFYVEEILQGMTTFFQDKSPQNKSLWRKHINDCYFQLENILVGTLFQNIIDKIQSGQYLFSPPLPESAGPGQDRDLEVVKKAYLEFLRIKENYIWIAYITRPEIKNYLVRFSGYRKFVDDVNNFCPRDIGIVIEKREVSLAPLRMENGQKKKKKGKK